MRWVRISQSPRTLPLFTYIFPCVSARHSKVQQVDQSKFAILLTSDCGVCRFDVAVQVANGVENTERVDHLDSDADRGSRREVVPGHLLHEVV